MLYGPPSARVIERRHARDHHDVAACLLLHARDHELRQAVRGEGVDANDTFELRRVGVFNGIAAAGDAGVVDQDVDIAEVRRDLVDHRDIGVPVVDRRPVGFGCSPGGSDLRHGFRWLPLHFASVVHTNSSAVGRQPHRDRIADSPSTACHECNPSLERHEISLSKKCLPSVPTAAESTLRMHAGVGP